MASLLKQYATNTEPKQLLLDALLAHYQPATLTACANWLNWFSPQLLLTNNDYDAGQLLETIAAQAPQNFKGSRATNFGENMKGLITGLLKQPHKREAAHRAYLKICAAWPVESVFYLSHCLSMPPPVERMIEDCLDLVIQQGCVPALRQVVFSAAAQNGVSKSERTQRAAELIRLLDSLTARSDVLHAPKLESTHFSEIFRVFNPQGSVSRADMVVAVIAHLQPRLNPRWLTPVSYHIEALGYARRFEEATRLAKEYQELTVGRDREKAERFLSGLSGAARSIPENNDDYARLIKAYTTV